jgi:hypothetical protein
MPQVEFEPTVSVFERAKTAHALDRAATVIGADRICNSKELTATCENIIRETKFPRSPDHVLLNCDKLKCSSLIV